MRVAVATAGTGLRQLSARYGPKILSARVYPEFFPIDPHDVVVNVGCGEGTQVIAYGTSFKTMVGIDVSRARLERSRVRMREAGVDGVAGVCALAESVPLRSGRFDKALAIDVVEHVVDPAGMCRELHRLLRPGGRLLMTFPAMHDRFTDAAALVGRVLPGRRSGAGFRPASDGWDPDAHNHELPVGRWVRLVESEGFELIAARGSTLFPPLHLYGVPRFWFSNEWIHAIDSRLCGLPLLRRFGQALVCDFRRS